MKHCIQIGKFSLVAFLILTGCRPTEVLLNDTGLRIKGMYGVTIPYVNIEQIDTLTALPKISMKTNGYALGKTLIGNFKFKDHSRAKLFVKKGFKPYVVIKSKETVPVYLNFEDRTRTAELYNRLLKETTK